MVPLRLDHLSPAQWCQAFFVLSSGLVVAIQVLPRQASTQLIAYGARQEGKGPASADEQGQHVRSREEEKEEREKPRATTRPGENENPQNQARPGGRQGDGDGRLLALLRTATSAGQVPHKWFVHFYMCSIAWSTFWACQFASRGAILRHLAALQTRGNSSLSSAPGLEQLAVVWAMMLLQGTRRLYECLAVMKPGSSSKMWFTHYFLGLFYYSFVSVSVWIEGSASLSSGISDLRAASALSPKTATALVLYIIGCVQQHRAHKHLAGLKKYTLPDQGWFRTLLCPHYTAECLIYTALAIGAAPKGRLFNRTLLSALLFVAVNLGATGINTKRWYIEKFGAEKVARRWIMIPGVF